MKLLFDQNLRFKLSALLSDLFPDSKPVRDLGLDRSDDRIVWQHAKDNLAHQVELPTSALRLLVDVLSELSNGNAVPVVPVHAELTTQEAADLLNVSRPHLIKLLEEGLLPHHKTGKHRRVRFEHLMHFKSERDRASEIAMEELAKQAQELETGYLACIMSTEER